MWQLVKAPRRPPRGTQGQAQGASFHPPTPTLHRERWAPRGQRGAQRPTAAPGSLFTTRMTGGLSSGSAVPLTSQNVPGTEVPHRGLQRGLGSGEIKVTAAPLRAPARRKGWPLVAAPPPPRPAQPARASRSPRPAPSPRRPALPAAPAPRGAGWPCGGSPERPCGGMRGRGGGRASWPAPVRSLLRAFGARDAAAAARGPEQGKRRGASRSPALGHWLGLPCSLGGRLWPQTRAVRAAVRSAGLGV